MELFTAGAGAAGAIAATVIALLAYLRQRRADSPEAQAQAAIDDWLRDERRDALHR